MEDPPRKHDKKNNNQTFPVTVNIGAGAGAGAGSFGIGGVVLLGGALVTATIVSALAFKRRKQHRSSSENSDKNMSPETKTGDGSNHLELMKSNKDFSVDPILHYPSDTLTSMKEMQIKDIQDLVVDEKHDYGMNDDEQLDSGDGNEGVICLVVSEDKKSTSSYVDSVFESGELDSEEEVIMEAQNEDDSSKVLQRGVGGEEQKYLMPIDNENDEQVEAKSLVSDKDITPIEKYEAIEGVEVEESLAKDITVEATQDEVRIGDDVAQAPEEENEEGEDQETVFIIEEAACVKQVIVEDSSQVQFIEEQKKESGYCDDEIIVENFKGDLIDDTSNAYEIDNPTQLMNKEEEVKEQATIEDGSVKFHEKEKVCKMPHIQLLEAAKVDDQTEKREDSPPTNLTNNKEKVEETTEMITDDESVKKDEIPHVQSVEEYENNEEDVTVKTEVVSDELEDSSVKSKQEEPAPHAQLVEEGENNEEDLAVKTEVVSDELEDSSVKSMQDKPAPHVQSVEGSENNEEDVTVKTKVVPDELEDSSVKSMQPTPYVQSVEVENTEEDVTTKTGVVPYEIEKSFVKSMQEEPAPEAKTSNQNIEENTEKNGTILGKVQSDSDLNNSVKEDEDNKSASMSVIELAKGRKEALASEPWNLKLLAWSLLVSIWCLCHWYTQLPFPELSLVGSLLFILILLGYRNRTTYLVKYA